MTGSIWGCMPAAAAGSDAAHASACPLVAVPHDHLPLLCTHPTLTIDEMNEKHANTPLVVLMCNCDGSRRACAPTCGSGCAVAVPISCYERSMPPFSTLCPLIDNMQWQLLGVCCCLLAGPSSLELRDNGGGGSPMHRCPCNQPGARQVLVQGYRVASEQQNSPAKYSQTHITSETVRSLMREQTAHIRPPGELRDVTETTELALRRNSNQPNAHSILL